MNEQKMNHQDTKAQSNAQMENKPRPLRVFIAHAPEFRYQALKLAVICGSAGMENNLTSHRTFDYDGCDMGIILRESSVTVSLPGRRALIFNLEVIAADWALAAGLFKELSHEDPHRHRQIYGLTLAAIGLMQLASL